ncbi:PREDICTED: protein MAATS1-like [Ceratosolen solmsi marchali]|uniref:Cilia- and flagella-associated protein 91 n=1 Tax=Ceratosolen solmsi marchali TaxID=326594 RepID=A0AAJ6VL59_9HYME|nr:PREDICTED: protein MAATS1-like [Ceratosolen solmsi marchali]
MCNNRMSSHLEGSIFGSGVQNIHRQYYGLQNLSNHFKNKGVQTDYRESDCQTLPWEPPYQIAPGHNPEVLMLKHFRWGMELPAGMHELEIINRMRKRRAWERILPPMDTLANIKIRSALIADLENDEWAFREAEIQFLMNLRMALEDTSMQHKANKKNKQTENRLKKLNESLNKRKQQEMDSIRNTFTRELRKLATKHRSIRTGQEKSSIIKLHAERNLNFYNPKLRRGYAAEYYYDESFSDSKFIVKMLKYNILNKYVIDMYSYMKFNEVEKEETSLDWFFVTREPNYTTSKTFIRICPRVSKRNNKKLLELSQNLESIKTKFEFSDTYASLKRKQQIMLLPATPYQLPPKRFENEMDLPSSFLRKLLNGRAEQCMFKDLIKDLQSVQILENSNNLSNETIRLKLKQLEKNCNEILQAIDGKTIVNVLIFLNNELTTLYKETAYVSFLYKEKAQTQEQFELQRFRAAQASVKKCMSIPANYVDRK